VTGQLSNAVHHYAVEDNATVMIEYDGGVRGVVDVRWHSKVKRDECRIRGTDGEMDLDPLNGPELVYPTGSESLPPHANLHYPMIENFVDAVEGKAPLFASGAVLVRANPEQYLGAPLNLAFFAKILCVVLVGLNDILYFATGLKREVDGVGAGVDEKVLVVLEGRAAGEALGRKGAPVDAAIIGIIDTVTIG